MVFASRRPQFECLHDGADRHGQLVVREGRTDAATVPSAEGCVLKRRRLVVQESLGEEGLRLPPQFGVEMQCGQSDSDHVAGRAGNTGDGQRPGEADVARSAPSDVRAESRGSPRPRYGRCGDLRRRGARPPSSSTSTCANAFVTVDVEQRPRQRGRSWSRARRRASCGVGHAARRRRAGRPSSSVASEDQPRARRCRVRRCPFALRSARTATGRAGRGKATRRAHGPRPAISRRSQGTSISAALPDRSNCVVTRAYSGTTRTVRHAEHHPDHHVQGDALGRLADQQVIARL